MKVFSYLVEPASYALDLAKNVYEKNDVDIEVNTTRLNNEIIKQRLSCIPIFIRNVEEDALSEYEIEIDESNDHRVKNSIFSIIYNFFKTI